MAKAKVSKRQILMGVGVAGLLLLAVGAGVVAMLIVGRGPQAQVVQIEPPPRSVEEARNLRLEGNSQEATKKIDEALNNPTASDDERYLLYFQQAVNFVDQQKWQEAVDSYLKADAIKPTYEVAALIAETWTRAGQGEKAIEYHRLAIKRLPADKPTAETDKVAHEAAIRSLGGRP